jgi:valyl-tRNA synthetase
MEARHFMNATAVCYDFWLYELCDVYIVRGLQRSPLRRWGTPSHRKR